MKVKQPYTDQVSVPALGGRWVQPGEVIAIPDGELASFLEASWMPADDRTLAASLDLLTERRISQLCVLGTDGETVERIHRDDLDQADEDQAEGDAGEPAAEEGAQAE